MQIRLARADEVEQLREIEASAATLFAGSTQSYVATAAVTPAAVYQTCVEHGEVAVAERADELLGFCVYRPIDGELHLLELSVRRERQRQGVGQALISWTVDRARALGLPAVTLTTFISIPWNAPYYLRHSFEQLAAGTESPGVRAIIERQASLGLDITDRCAMRREV